MFAAAFALVMLHITHANARADEVAGALYVRTDNDSTTVISPRVHANKQFGESTNVDVTYTADIWTSASVDIRASASVRPVSEQRDELDLGVRQDWNQLHVRAGYRFSTEHDYTSHGATLGGALDLSDKAATLDANLRLYADTVGRAGDPSFSRALTTLDGALSYTQLLDPQMFLMLTYELAYNHGYQASPYRFVGVGGNGFGCGGAFDCYPERTPELRLRHALALLVRRALSDTVSIALHYRFYVDDWSLSSHTVLGELGYRPAERTLLSLRYRFYTQGHASFYQKQYFSLTPDQNRTRDKELSQLGYHRAGVELEQAFPVGSGRLSATFAVSGNLYHYTEFVGLNHVVALEVSAALLLEI